MPPHCDSMDGPVVLAAKAALAFYNVDLILPYVPKDHEEELKKLYTIVVQVRNQGDLAHELADHSFFETVVRLHRAGEGAPYTGLKPAGLSTGPVIPLAEQAIETESLDALLDMLTRLLRSELIDRFEHLLSLKRRSNATIDEMREFVGVMLGFQIYSHALYTAIKAAPHSESHQETNSQRHEHEVAV